MRAEAEALTADTLAPSSPMITNRVMSMATTTSTRVKPWSASEVTLRDRFGWSHGSPLPTHCDRPCANLFPLDRLKFRLLQPTPQPTISSH